MAGNLYELRKEVQRLETEFASLPPTFMAPTLTERDNNIHKYNRIKQELANAREALKKAEGINARLLANAKIKKAESKKEKAKIEADKANIEAENTIEPKEVVMEEEE